MVVLEANSQSQADLDTAYDAVKNYTEGTAGSAGIFYIGVNTPPHASILTSSQNLTTMAFMDIDDMYGNNTMSQIPLCPRGLSPDLVQYTDRVVQNYTVQIEEHVVTIVNQTVRIDTLTQWIDKCTCGCAQQSPALQVRYTFLHVDMWPPSSAFFSLPSNLSLLFSG